MKTTLSDASHVVAYKIEGMCCSVEEGLIRDRLSTLAGVARLDFNTVKRVVTIHHNLESEIPLQKSIREIGFEPLPLQQGSTSNTHGSPGDKKQKRVWLWLISGGIAALASEAAEWLGIAHPYLPAALALLAISLAGLDTFRKGVLALINRNLNINALMSIAVVGAVILGQWPEAAMVMVLFALAEYIEDKSLDRARNAIAGLVALVPSDSTVQQDDGSWQSIAAPMVRTGQLVRVRPGERISHDGFLVEGSTSIDQAAITGESIPVEKTANDQIFAGTINQNGEFTFRVSAQSDATLVSRIIHLVEEAQASRAPTQRFVDRFARVYTPLVCAAAVLIAVLPPLFFGGAWHDWVYKALVLLVIACPCALVIATPITIVSALAAAARAGMIIKGGAYLELGRKLKHVVFDKTGTLTQGRPVLTDFLPLIGDETKLRNIAFSLAERSDHPVSRAIALAPENQGLSRKNIASFLAIPGLGIQGTIEGTQYFLGNQRAMQEQKIPENQAVHVLAKLEAEGKTTLILATQEVVLAVIGVADVPRVSAAQTIAGLHTLGLQTHILSGDNAITVSAIAQKLGIDKARGNCLPQDKLDHLQQLSAPTHAIAFVGDGINDTPALAKADIGFSLGNSGIGTAIETADVVLMNDDLRLIPAFVRLARKASSVLIQNIGIALGIKGLFLALTLVGIGTLWMAVFADVGASLIVIFNGLRMLKKIKL